MTHQTDETATPGTEVQVHKRSIEASRKAVEEEEGICHTTTCHRQLHLQWHIGSYWRCHQFAHLRTTSAPLCKEIIKGRESITQECTDCEKKTEMKRSEECTMRFLPTPSHPAL